MSPGGLQSPSIEYDGTVRVNEISPNFYQELQRMGPFGQGNPEPLIRITGARFVSSPKFFGKNFNHLRAALTDDQGGMQDFLAWRAKDDFEHLISAPKLDLLLRPQVEYFRGNAQHRLVLVDGGVHQA